MKNKFSASQEKTTKRPKPKLTTAKYYQQKLSCNKLCDIDSDRVSQDNPTIMPCVTCPFCKQLVDALLTPSTISCPACKVTVNR